MAPESARQIADALNGIASKLSQPTYTLTGAADWPILYIVGGIVIVMIGIMWADLRGTIKDNRTEWKADLDKETNILWKETREIRQNMKECKEKCCE